jgi:hypothetical protein
MDLGITPRRHEGDVEIKLYEALILALNGGEW